MSLRNKAAKGGSSLPPCSQSSITKMGLDMLREEARVNDALLSMATDHENQLRKLHESAIDTLIVLRAVKRDIEARAESILSENTESK